MTSAARCVARLALCLAAYSSCVAQRPTHACATARDLTVQALEHVSAASPDRDVEGAILLLRRAISLCPTAGDAWYYRSVMEAKLKQDPSYALSRARIVGSPAMTEGVNPFVLATPRTPAPPATAPSAGQRWALVIGISQFAEPDFGKLAYTASDAKAFADALGNASLTGAPAYHLRTLMDGQATTKAIRAELNHIAREAKEEDTVVIYVATHGAGHEHDDAGQLSYLITADTEWSSTEVAGDRSSYQDALVATSIPMIDLVNIVATSIKARRTAIFLDACHSGAAAEGMDALKTSVARRTLDGMRQGSGRIIMTASGEGENSYESAALQHGYFTYALLQAMQASPDSPLTQLFEQVRSDVSSRVAADKKKFHYTQTPTLARSSDDTDFSLGLPKTAASSAAPGPPVPR